MTEATQYDSDELQSLRNGHKPQIVAGLNRPQKIIPLGEQWRAVRRQELMVILGNISILAAGMSLALPTVAKDELTDAKSTLCLTDSQFSWFASLNTLACPLGGLLSGVLLDKIGRKNTLYALNIINLSAWVVMALSSQTDVDIMYIQLLVSRCLAGIAWGLSTAPVGIYSAEISLPKIRGRLILATSVAVALGITLAYGIGYFIRNDFRLIAMFCCAYQIVALLCVIPMPESPCWLATKLRNIEAKKSLNYFRGFDKTADITHPEVLAEFNLLQKSVQIKEIGVKKPSFVQLLREPEVHKPLLIMIGLFAFQQLTGIFVVVVYAVQISNDAGVTIDLFLSAILIGLARVVTTCFMGIILEQWGRRRAGIISALGMCVCMCLLVGHSWSAWLHSVPYLAVSAIVAYIVLSTLGLYTLPFFMISELFPQKVRGPASGLTVAVGVFIAFICIKTYPDLKSAIGNDNVFVIFAVMSLIAMIFIYFVLPETRGRTLLEIEEEFRCGKSSTVRSRKAAAAIEMREVYVR